MNLLWIDLEATGSHVIEDHIMEVGAFITDGNFTRLSDNYHSILNLYPAAYRQLIREGNEVVIDMHTKNGLILDCIRSNVRRTETEDELQELVKPYLNEYGKIRVAGSGVAAYDKPMLETHMPGLSSHFYYSCLDVGHIRRFLEYCGVQIERDKEDLPHRALDDVLMHYDEALVYKNALCQLR